MIATLVIGCLPRGAPPAGRQIFADRRMSLAAMVPPDGDGLLRILVTRTGDAADSKDLYVVALDSTDTPVSQLLLVRDYDESTGLGCSYGVAPCSLVQARSVSASTKQHGQVWVDPVTGDQLDVTLFSQIASPSGQRTFVWDQTTTPTDFGMPPGTTGTGTLHEADGTSTALDDVTFPTFSPDDDFFYETSSGDLMHVPPSSAPEQVTSGLVPPGSGQLGPPFHFITSADGLLLVLTRPTTSGQQSFVRDPLTGQETPLPSDDNQYFSSASAAGPWLLDPSMSFQGRFTFFNYRDGTTDVVDLATLIDSFGWRPGHNELWVSSEALSANTWILSPGVDPVMVPGRNLADGFTPDGEYWLWTPDFNTSETSTYVGRADDPEGPSSQLNPFSSNAIPVWMLSNDRVLGAVYYKMQDYQERTDAVLLDPRTGETLVLGERGRIAAVGQTRSVGIFHFHEERGDLTVGEFDTGRLTILAPEFATTAFAEPQGADQLAPGTRIVYQFQARTDSPYDGIWIATCP
jgi:hypothetical protein